MIEQERKIQLMGEVKSWQRGGSFGFVCSSHNRVGRYFAHIKRFRFSDGSPVKGVHEHVVVEGLRVRFDVVPGSPQSGPTPDAWNIVLLDVPPPAKASRVA